MYLFTIKQKPKSYNTFFAYFVVQLIQCSLLFGRHRKVVHKGFSVVLFAEINFKMTLSNFHSFLADFFQCVYPFLTTKNWATIRCQGSLDFFVVNDNTWHFFNCVQLRSNYRKPDYRKHPKVGVLKLWFLNDHSKFNTVYAC